MSDKEIKQENESPIAKQPRVKKPRNLEEQPRLKPGRKVGCFSAPQRHLENGKYNSKPNDPEYFKKYYHQVVKQPYTCPRCDSILSSKSLRHRHEKTIYCMHAYTTKNHEINDEQ